MANDKPLRLISTAFSHNGHIPPQYTCEGKNVNPPLKIENIPGGAKSLAIIVEDPDASRGVFDHWVMWNIPVNAAIAEESQAGINGTNSFGQTGYGGPCPPSGVHRYFFKLYALDKELDLAPGAGKNELLDAMKGHVLATAELMGVYQKHKHTVAG